jgi:hypothetical protein
MSPEKRREPFERPPHPSPSLSLHEDTYFDPRTKVLAAASPRRPFKYLKCNGYFSRRGFSIEASAILLADLPYARRPRPSHQGKWGVGIQKYSCRPIRSHWPGPSGGVEVLPRAEGSLQRIHDQRLRFETKGRASMSENTACDASVSGPTPAESLKMLLDYAIAEGGELHLPVFVLLLRMANLELAKSARRQPRLNSDSPSLRDAAERVAP